MIDSHCHLDFAVFDEDRDKVVAESLKLGVSHFLLPATEYSAWSKQIQLAQEYSQFYFALGLHPYFLQNFQANHLLRLREQLNLCHQKLVAVGEIGLDFALQIDQDLQLDVFQQQLDLASEFNLPVIIHQRKAHHALIGALKRAKLPRSGVIHAFSGSYQQACEYLDLGFKLGIGGTITYERAQKTKATLKKLPLSSFLLETDSPDMPISGMQGQRNSPANLPEISRQLGLVMAQPLEMVSEQTTANFNQLFLNT